MADEHALAIAEDGPDVALEAFLSRLQATVERVHQVALDQHERRLDRFVDDDGTPLVRRIKVPDPTATGWRELEVPLLALAPLTAMQMHELSVEFSTSVVSVLDGVLDGVPDEFGGRAPRASHEAVVRLERPPSSGAGPATVRVVFQPGRPHRSDVVIDFDDDGSGPREVVTWRPDVPIRPPRRQPMATDPNEDFAFTIEGMMLVGEERIDPHEEEATVVTVVRFEVVNADSMWELADARLSIDVAALPDSIALEGGEPVEEAMHFPLDVDELLGHGEVEVVATVKTGTFAVPGGPAAEGSHRIAARVEGFYVPVAGGIAGATDGEVTIDVAPD